VNLRTLEGYVPIAPNSLEDLLELDARARLTAEKIISSLNA
jgi:hypothetical protein